MSESESFKNGKEVNGKEVRRGVGCIGESQIWEKVAIMDSDEILLKKLDTYREALLRAEIETWWFEGTSASIRAAHWV